MATFRVGVGSFNINDGSVGIGTEGTGHGNLKVEGTIKSTNLDVLGVSTFTRYSGFSADEVKVGNRDLTLSGEYSTTGDIVVEDGASLTVGLGSTACTGAVECISVKKHFSVPSGDTAQRNETSGYAEGTVRYNIDLGTMEFFNGNEWRQFTYIADIQNNSSSRGRSVHAGGANPVGGSFLPTISSFEHATQGQGNYFGDLSVGGQGNTAFSSRIYGFNAGRRTPSTNPDNIIDYVTISSFGNAIDFGDMTDHRRLGASFSSSTRGIMAGGITPSRVNVIDYVEMSTKGDATDFGDTFENFANAMNGISNGVRGVYNGGQDGSSNISENIQFLTISSKGNALKFGELTNKRRSTGTCSNSTRGVFAAGYNGGAGLSSIEFITISSEGNGTDFGDLSRSATTTYTSGSASQTRAFFSGGYYQPAITGEIDYLLFSSGGNTIPFGDLSVPSESGSACSDSHGGLGGY